MPPIHIVELFGSYVIVMSKGDAMTYALVYFALLMSIPFLANLRQPEPMRVNWGAVNHKTGRP